MLYSDPNRISFKAKLYNLNINYLNKNSHVQHVFINSAFLDPLRGFNTYLTTN